MTLSIKNCGYAFLIRLDLMFYMSLCKEFQLLQILNDLSIRHLIKLILYENDVKHNDIENIKSNLIKNEYPHIFSSIKSLKSTLIRSFLVTKMN